MKSIVSIEIGRDSIKAAEIAGPDSKNPKVVKIGEMPLPAGVAGESLIHESAKFTVALEELWKQEKFSTRRVVLAVSGRRFMVRELETAHVSMKDFYNVMKYEVSTVIPDQMKDPVVDFFPMYNKKELDGIKTVGLVVATPSEPIEGIIECINQAKLELMFVEFAPMSIARYIRNNIESKEGSGYALANIREYSTDILIAKDNIPRMIRVAADGLTPSTRKKGRHMKDELPVSLGMDDLSEKTPVEAMARSIKITVNSQLENLGIDIDTLYITGSRTDDETMKAISDLTNMQVIPLSIDMVNHKEGLDEELTSSDFVAVCAGMRGKK